jgi:hypothetical protein
MYCLHYDIYCSLNDGTSCADAVCCAVLCRAVLCRTDGTSCTDAVCYAVLCRNASFLACLPDKALLRVASSSYSLSLNIDAITPSKCKTPIDQYPISAYGGFASKYSHHQLISRV